MNIDRFHITINAWENAVESTADGHTKVLKPGRYWRRPGSTYATVDLRLQTETVALQEFPCADGISVRASAMATYTITDPHRYILHAEQPTTMLYHAIQETLRKIAATVDAVDFPRHIRSDDGKAALTAEPRDIGAQLGMTVHDVTARDVLLPNELRTATLAALTAKLEGAAALERARAETAALRCRANGAKLLDNNPALAAIALMEAVPAGATVHIAPPEPTPATAE